MVVSPYRTSVTRAHQDDGKTVAPSITRRSGPGTRRKNPARYDRLNKESGK